MAATLYRSGIFVITAALLSAGCSDSGSTEAPAAKPTFSNPVLYADYSDPDVIRSGDSYYLLSSSFHLSPGLPILRSKDLVNWTIVSYVLAMLPLTEDYDRVGGRYGGGPWAPSIREHDGKFYVYWANSSKSHSKLPMDSEFCTSRYRSASPAKASSSRT